MHRVMCHIIAGLDIWPFALQMLHRERVGSPVAAVNCMAVALRPVLAGLDVVSRVIFQDLIDAVELPNEWSEEQSWHGFGNFAAIKKRLDDALAKLHRNVAQAQTPAARRQTTSDALGANTTFASGTFGPGSINHIGTFFTNGTFVGHAHHTRSFFGNKSFVHNASFIAPNTRSLRVVQTMKPSTAVTRPSRTPPTPQGPASSAAVPWPWSVTATTATATTAPQVTRSPLEASFSRRRCQQLGTAKPTAVAAVTVAVGAAVTSPSQ